MAKQKIGFVYLVYSETRGLHKIGLSAKPGRRLKQLGACVLIHTVSTNDARRLERELHEAHAAVRAEGEWFRLDEAMVAGIRGIEARMYEVGRPLKAAGPRVNVGVPAPWNGVARKVAAKRQQPVLYLFIALLEREAKAQGLTDLPTAPWEEDDQVL